MNEQSNSESNLTMIARQKLVNFSKSIFCISCFFWAWAVLNIVSGKLPFDLGCISFATSATSSYYLLRSTTQKIPKISGLVKNLTTASYLFVSVNYALGAMISSKKNFGTGFFVYCLLFTGVWLGFAMIGRSLIKSYNLISA